MSELRAEGGPWQTLAGVMPKLISKIKKKNT